MLFFKNQKTAEVGNEDINGETELNVDRQILDSTVKTLLFDSPTNTELNVDPQVLESTVKTLLDSPAKSYQVLIWLDCTKTPLHQGSHFHKLSFNRPNLACH